MKRFYFSFIIVGLLISIISLVGIFKPDEDYLTTQGTIIRIEEYWDTIDDTYSYTPIINYEVNGVKYDNIEYGAYDSSMKVGDKVTVYYSPTDPTRIQAEGYKTVPYITLPFALLITIYGIYKVIK